MQEFAGTVHGMSIEPPANSSPAEAGNRPYTVDVALYAILARCLFGVLSGLALFTARSRIIRDFRTSQPKNAPVWTDAKLNHEATSALVRNLILAVVLALMVLVIAKYVRDGRNWARWLYLGISVFPTSDIFKVAGFAQNVPLLYKITTGLTGAAAIVAVSLLFVRPSAPYFRRQSGRPMGGNSMPSMLALFKPKSTGTATSAGTTTAGTNKSLRNGVRRETVRHDKHRGARDRPVPKAKSRKSGSE